MDQKNYLVSIIIVNYKEYDFLRRCLDSLKHTYKNSEIIVVDNESDESALEEIRKDFKDIKLFGLKENLNYAEGNNFGILHSSGKYVVILNNDTIVEKNWLDPLIEAASANSEAFYQPKMLYLEKPEMINSFGNAVHLFGFAFPIAIGKNVADVTMTPEKPVKIFYCGGACIFTSREVLDKLGGFDSNYWTYYEDVNLGWKGNLYGYPSYVVASSTIYHKSGVSHGLGLSRHKLFLLERGRLSSLFRNLSLRSILILLPFILALDVMIILYLMPRKGMAKAKLYASFTMLKNWRTIYQERKRIQKSRITKDKDLSILFSTYIEHPYLDISPRSRKLLSFVSKYLKTLL